MVNLSSFHSTREFFMVNPELKISKVGDGMLDFTANFFFADNFLGNKLSTNLIQYSVRKFHLIFPKTFSKWSSALQRTLFDVGRLG